MVIDMTIVPFYLCTFRLLTSRNEDSLDSLHSFLTYVAQESVLSSWTELTSHLDQQRRNSNGLTLGKAKAPQLSSVSWNHY